jgi:hypothetical protein
MDTQRLTRLHDIFAVKKRDWRTRHHETIGRLPGQSG